MFQDFLKIAETACRRSGDIQREGLKRDLNIVHKGEINLVTDVDHACEKEIVGLIQGTYPQHDILAEEGSGIRKDSEYKWIIDPLDGTTNYTHGYPLFCTSIALEYRGEIVVGAVYDPSLDEMFLAEKGGGATCNGAALKVSEVEKVSHALLCTGFAYNIKETANNNLNHFRNFLLRAQAVRRDGVAAVDLCYVAMGRFDGFWELNLFPWDMAAGVVILREAGGKITTFSGSSFDIYQKDILATNGRVHGEMVEILGQGA